MELNEQISKLIEEHGIKRIIDAVARWVSVKAIESEKKGSYWRGYRIMHDKLKQI